MFLIITATELEMRPLRDRLPSSAEVEFLVTGPGPLETAVKLVQRMNASPSPPIKAFINCGVSGAFTECGIAPLDMCVASREVLGDFGICGDDRVTVFQQQEMNIPTEFDLTTPLFHGVMEHLSALAIAVFQGTFVTVNCASGTQKRADFLRDTHGAICENMEGAAIARVATCYDIPLVEIRCVSNIIRDRHKQDWRLREAAEKCGLVVSRLLPGISC